MKKVALLCFAMLLLFTQTAVAGAASRDNDNKLVSLICKELKADDSRPAGIRLEIGITNDKVNYQVLNDSRENSLIIEFDNSRIKKLKRKVKLNNSIVKTINLDREKQQSRVVIDTVKPVTDDKYKVYILPADHTTKEPARLIVELYSESIGAYAPGLIGKTIVLDAGHGGSDPGAIGPNGIREKDVAFAVTNKLAARLKNAGVNVVLTRTSDVDVYAPHASGAQELQARVNVAERNNAAAFISIHANSFTSPSAHGTETYYYSGSTAGRKLASVLQNGMMKHINLTNRGIEGANFYVLKRSSMPSALVELAFISNYNEERLLASDKFQNQLAAGLYDGLVEYFK